MVLRRRRKLIRDKRRRKGSHLNFLTSSKEDGMGELSGAIDHPL